MLNSDQAKKEAEYYKIVDVPIPNDIKLEVGGLALTDKNQLGVSTRRGEVWLVNNPYSKTPVFNRFAHGMHETLGLAYKDNGFYLAQRGELTRLEDKNNDGVAIYTKRFTHGHFPGIIMNIHMVQSLTKTVI
ncbi:probable large multifunctional secreted protein [Algibacter lectus]|uniref:Probable large multifunctional secreted protein n=2 Tax=Algibacter lectus TaxID=221126 RepID=A0A090VJ71_9FLAO|nr:probable large multifunctional secreted protein [Algibacter lectus]